MLIFGDVLASFDLSAAIQDHMNKKKQKAIVTRIFKKMPLNHPLRTEDDDCVVIVDSNNSLILDYKQIREEKEVKFHLGESLVGG